MSFSAIFILFFVLISVRRYRWGNAGAGDGVVTKMPALVLRDASDLASEAPDGVTYDQLEKVVIACYLLASFVNLVCVAAFVDGFGVGKGLSKKRVGVFLLPILGENVLLCRLVQRKPA